MDDTYFVTVRFERMLSEDQKIARRKYPDVPLEEALRRQLRDELQAACEAGMAGMFKVGDVNIPG